MYWIGGGSGAGKSTVARRIADRYGLRVYSTDDAMAEHARRCGPEDCPLLDRFVGMSMDERWVNRSPEVMLDTFHWFRGEGFGLVVEDLLRMAGAPVIVEGFRLLPRLVGPILADRSRAVWLLPSPEFRREVMARRVGGFLDRTSDPERALENLLERDRMFTERVRAEVAELGLQAIRVEVGMAEDESARLVAEWLGLCGTAG